MDKQTAKAIVKESVSKAVAYCGTQMNLANKAGITQGAVRKYLIGESLPTGVTAKKLSKAVDNNQLPCEFAPHIFDAK
jgi:hypothetical protein